MREAVIIPALDEEQSLPGVLASLPRLDNVLVVDNGSTDRTVDVARDAGAAVIEEARRGYGSAVLAGIDHLSMRPPEVLVILDADGADDPARMGELTSPIHEDRADFVLADRSHTARPGALSPHQRFGNRLATALIAAQTGHHYADMAPFRAVRWSSLVAMGMRDPTWGWNVEMQMRAVQQDLRILEIPLPYGQRTAGRSKISGTLIGSLRAGVRILDAVRRYR